jgi:hypothetical protein
MPPRTVRSLPREFRPPEWQAACSFRKRRAGEDPRPPAGDPMDEQDHPKGALAFMLLYLLLMALL